MHLIHCFNTVYKLPIAGVRHCQVTTLGKLFTDTCLCSPSSIIWYRPKGSDAPWLGK